MILHLASKCAISATALLQDATDFMRRFCGTVRKIMVTLKKKLVNSINLYLLSMKIIASFVS